MTPQVPFLKKIHFWFNERKEYMYSSATDWLIFLYLFHPIFPFWSGD